MGLRCHLLMMQLLLLLLLLLLLCLRLELCELLRHCLLRLLLRLC